LVKRERKGRGGARRDSRLQRQAGEAEEKKKGRGREEADRWVPSVSVGGEKEKKRRLGGPLGVGLMGRQAWLGRKVRRVALSFFLFFSNSF
jgi:hypothetical protein